MPIGEQFRKHFPGLIPIEAQLWRIWLQSHESDFDSFEYNVFVGKGVTVAPHVLEADTELERKLREQFRQATQKKIDVVGMRGNETWIFEVEERPGTRALGQLLTYSTLLPQKRPIPGAIQLAIVARRIGADMLTAFEDQGILVWQIRL